MDFFKKVIKILSYLNYSVNIQDIVNMLNDIDKNKDAKITVFELVSEVIEKLEK